MRVSPISYPMIVVVDMKIWSIVAILAVYSLLSGCAIVGNYGTAISEQDIHTVNTLIKQGADVNERVLTGRTPLMGAAATGNLEIVKILVENGADINAVSDADLGISPLRNAAFIGNKNIVDYLVGKGADIDRAIFAMKRATNEFIEKDNSLAIEYLQEYKKSLAPAPRLETHSPPPRIAAATPSVATTPVVVQSDVDIIPASMVAKRSSAVAVVIGVEDYRQQLPKADFASRDARLVSDYLVKALGYPEENVVTLINDRALKSDFEKYFEKWLGNNVEKDSTVFIYYSGHGAPNPKTGGAYLVPYDGDPSFIDQTGYSLKRLYDALGALSAKQIVVVLDSCFSGAGGRSIIAKGARPLVMNFQKDMLPARGIKVLTASSGDQISSTYDEKGHGLFTYFLMKAVRDEDVVNQDGTIRIDQLYSSVKPQVERIARKQYNNEQIPQLVAAE